MRFAALWENAQKSARARAGCKCEVNIVAKIESIARRRAIEQQVQPLGVGFPSHIVQSDARRKRPFAGLRRACGAIVARAARE